MGPQQAFLVQEQEKYFKLGDEYRAKKGITDKLIIKLENLNLDGSITIASYSEKDKDIMEKGDIGQGNRLTKEKKKKKDKKEK